MVTAMHSWRTEPIKEDEANGVVIVAETDDGEFRCALFTKRGADAPVAVVHTPQPEIAA